MCSNRIVTDLSSLWALGMQKVVISYPLWP